MKVYEVTDRRFRKYGRVVKGIDFGDMINVMEKKDIPQDVVYVPHIEELKACDSFKMAENSVFGGLEMQAGYCMGNNHLLNALEYHRNSEVNVAVTDMILLLGFLTDVNDDFTYETELVDAFIVRKGTAVELFATTLHYAPCNAGENGFSSVVLLPYGTNTDLETVPDNTEEDKLLVARNKWLIGHKEGGLPENSFIGLVGENVSTK